MKYLIEYDIVTDQKILVLEEVQTPKNINIEPNLSSHETNVIDTIKFDRKEFVDSFNEMNLRKILLSSVYGYGFKKPTDIQKRSIMPCIKGYDVIVQSPQSSGKSVAFIIFILQQINTKLNECQALILVPTRELALKIEKLITTIGDLMNVECYASISKTNVCDNVLKATYKFHVVVGTPGRVYNMIINKLLSTQFIKIFVLDEADKMSKNHKTQVKELFKFLEDDIQVILVSVTMPDFLLDISQQYMRNPMHIQGLKDELTLKGIKQFYINITKEEWKFDTLCDLCYKSTTKVLIFCNTRREVKELTEALSMKTFAVTGIHKKMNLHQRELNINRFCSGFCHILIATELSVQGIDINSNCLVINYDLPYYCQNYIPRIGHYGHYVGHKKIVINFITNNDKKALNNIEYFYNTSILKMPQNIVDVLYS